MSARLAAVLGALTLAFAAAPAPAPAATTPAAAIVHGGVVRQARLGRSFGSRGYGYRSSRRAPYGYRRHGHPFLRGLFFGWLLSHFFGGGFPLFPFVLLGFAFLMLRRRRGPRY